MSNTNDIYMAGLIDGEGTIGISYYSNKNFRSPYMSVTSTTREIIEWLHQTYGGTVSFQKKYHEHHKQSWCWRLTRQDDLFSLIERILPYMKEPDKMRRGRLLLAEYKSVTPRNGRYTEEMRERKLDFEARFLSRS